jgi:hypothetical protein
VIRSRTVAGLAGVVLAILSVAACDSVVLPQPQPVANPQVVCLAVPDLACKGAFDITG